MAVVDDAQSPQGVETNGRGDEAALLRRLVANEPRACEEFVRGQSGRALSVARGFVRDEGEAQDVVQEAFPSFFKSIGRFQAEASLATWFYHLVVNAALMRRRTRRRKPEAMVKAILAARGKQPG